PEDVSDEQVKKLLEAAIMAPSAGNMQPWDFIVVRDEGQKKALARAALGQMFVASAPVVIVVCANKPRTARRYGSRGSELYCLQDTAAATQNILLAATAMGLAGCWVGAFNEEEASRVLDPGSSPGGKAHLSIPYSLRKFLSETDRLFLRKFVPSAVSSIIMCSPPRENNLTNPFSLNFFSEDRINCSN
ncbi:MAG: nitroreductase family protein, partial [Candidatus Freyarchaeota archaeon]